MIVKENQPALYAAIDLLFAPPATLGPPLFADQREGTTRGRGHDRQQEVRTLVASSDLNDSLNWPGLGQVFRLTRTWRAKGVPKQALRYGITSLLPDAGPPDRLLALKRGTPASGYPGIENGLHRVKDVTLGEDQSTIYTGQGPTVMAFLRDAAVSLLHRAGVHHIAAHLRDHSHNPDPAIALVLRPPLPPTHA